MISQTTPALGDTLDHVDVVGYVEPAAGVLLGRRNRSVLVGDQRLLLERELVHALLVLEPVVLDLDHVRFLLLVSRPLLAHSSAS